MRVAALAMFVAFVMPACTTMDRHTSRNSLDWAGTYQGVLPCADCEGIETTLRLTPDGRYALTSRYLGGPGPALSDAGAFEWRGGGVIALQGSGAPRSYRVEEDRLRQLDTRGRPVEGALADRYVLRKVARSTASLENTYWKLLDAGGTVARASDNQQEPHFILHPADHRVSGSGGCNRLTGGYETSGDRLAFGAIASTMRACPSGMDTERAFLQALERVATWRIAGERLELRDAGGAVVARFESVYLK